MPFYWLAMGCCRSRVGLPILTGRAPASEETATLPLVPVVLCGGAGTRLWPLSRKHHPKQFARLTSGQDTLFRGTLERIAHLHCQHSIVVCNHAHRFFVAAELSEAERSSCTVLVEPKQRNTAPAATIAALHACREFGDAMLLLMPADHIIAEVDVLLRTVATAVEAARENHIVVFGIPPTRAETNYGYIHVDSKATVPAENTPAGASEALYKVTAFCEKPEQQTAAEWIARGNCYWNSGLVMVKASVYLQVIAQFEPDLTQSCEQAYAKRYDDLGFIYADATSFRQCRNISIDYAVLERADNVMVVPADMGWNDLGDWNTLGNLFAEDENNNRVQGKVMLKQASGNIVHAPERLVSVLGVDDCIVVDTADAVLVAARTHAPAIKDLVDAMQQQYPQANLPRKVFRPWGYYESLNKDENFQVKRIMINPGHSLSLQMHRHRSEHWVVVKGKARVTRGDEVFTLEVNQSTYIPVGVKHRLENIYDEAVRLIEVQCGEYLEEDDIVRFDDRYGRAKGE